MNVALEVQEREEDCAQALTEGTRKQIYEDVQIYESPPEIERLEPENNGIQMDFSFPGTYFLNFRGVAACFLFKTND